MTNDQITALLATKGVLKDVRLRPELDLAKIDVPHACDGFRMTFDEALGLWAIAGLTSTTHVQAADVISLRFSNFDKVAA